MSVNTATYAELLVMVAALKEENERLKTRVAEMEGALVCGQEHKK